MTPLRFTSSVRDAGSRGSPSSSTAKSKYDTVGLMPYHCSCKLLKLSHPVRLSQDVPALAKTWSIRPCNFRASLNNVRRSVQLVTSVLTKWFSSEACGSIGGFRSPFTTFAPRSCSRVAVASPIPEEPPLIRLSYSHRQRNWKWAIAYRSIRPPVRVGPAGQQGGW